MTPLFGKKDPDARPTLVVERRDAGTGQPTGSASAPTLDTEVARLTALSLEELAAEVMTGVMAFTVRSDSGPLEVFNIARVLLPAELRDAAQSDPRMWDLVGEAIQVLEQSRLVRLEAWTTQGQYSHVGYIATRLGLAALEQNNVAHILAGEPQ
jgi:hypothetical protein